MYHDAFDLQNVPTALNNATSQLLSDVSNIPVEHSVMAVSHPIEGKLDDE